MQYLSQETIDGVSADDFQGRRPYPWVNIQGTLTQEGFERLRETLPDISWFERKVGIKRGYGHAPNVRGILHYRPDLEPPLPWKEFIAELQGEPYQLFLRRMLNLEPRKRIILTLEWSYAWQNCCVAPHCDAQRKLATHIFYFNTEADWKASWGGQILILDDKGRFKAHFAPAFDELEVAAALDPWGNGDRFRSGRSIPGTVFVPCSVRLTSCASCSSSPSTCRPCRCGGGGCVARTRTGIESNLSEEGPCEPRHP